jgi:arylsulfatase A-like enzyme
MPIADGRVESVRDAVFAEGTYHAAYEPQRMIRTVGWKYVRRFEPRTRPVLPNTDDSPSKDAWLEHGWPEWLLAPEQLYDLTVDPGEVRNVVDDPTSAAVSRELRRRLEAWMEETDDPLLSGPVLPAPGVELNDPDQRSADDPTWIVPTDGRTGAASGRPG